MVCHSKPAAVRNRRAIRQALGERLDREKIKPQPDNDDLTRRLQQLKAVVVVSSDPTNEAAAITDGP